MKLKTWLYINTAIWFTGGCLVACYGIKHLAIEGMFVKTIILMGVCYVMASLQFMAADAAASQEWELERRKNDDKRTKSKSI